METVFHSLQLYKILEKYIKSFEGMKSVSFHTFMLIERMVEIITAIILFSNQVHLLQLYFQQALLSCYLQE